MAFDIKNNLKKVKNKFTIKGHKKILFYAIAALIVVVLFLVWLFDTNMGWIARSSWDKTFDTDSIHVVTVYDATGSVIKRYEGTYNVEDRGKYWIIMNVNTGERINIYGDCVLIIDNPRLNDKEKQGER